MSQKKTFGKLVVAFDGSPDSIRAVHAACDMMEKFGSELVLVHVYPPAFAYVGGATPGAIPDIGYLEEAATERGMKILAEGLAIVKERGKGCRTELIQAPSTVQALVEFCDNEKSDLVIAGTRGMTGFKKLVIGSVSGGLVSHAKCPVMVVR